MEHKADSWVANYAPDTNWGDAPNLSIQGNGIGRISRVLILHALPAFKPGITINSAKLYLYHYVTQDDPGTLTIVVHRLLDLWDESTVTWNNQPSYDDTVEASLTKSADTYGYWVWDITDLVKKWVSQGYPNYGLILRCTAYTPDKYGSVGFTSKENTLYNSSYLKIDYTPIATSITLTAEKSTLPVGSDIILMGTLEDINGVGIGGEDVTLQEYIDGTWTDISTTTTNTDGSFDFILSGYGIGSYTFRAVFKGSLNYSGSTSPEVTVTVTKIPTSISITSDKTTYYANEVAEFTGKLTRTDTGEGLANQTVTLQKLVGATWTDVGTGLTGLDGTYLIQYTMSEAGTFNFRTIFAGTETFDSAISSTLTITVNKIPTSLTLTPDKLKTVVDEIVNFLGELINSNTGAGIAGQTIELQQLIEGVWTTIMTGTTESDGTVTFSKTMGEVGDFAFRLIYGGTNVYEPSTSSSVSISVTKITTILSFSASVTEISVGGEVEFYGSLIRGDTGEGIPDQIIELQKLEDTIWTTVDTRRTDSTGSYRFYVKFDTEGTFRYRAYFSGSDKHLAADSTPIDITVTMPTYPTTLTLTASSLTAREGESITFSGYLRTENLEPIADAVIKLQELKEDLWADVGQTITDENGFYSIVNRFEEKGTYTIRTVFEGADPYGPSSSTPVTVTILAYVEKVKPRRMMMRLDVSKTSITLGETVKLWGNLGVISIMRTLPIPFQNVRIIVDAETIATLRTDITGSFEGEWKPDKAGDFDLYAEGLTRFLGIKIAESNHIIITVT